MRDRCLPDPDQRLARSPLASLVAEQADQMGSRNGPKAGKRLRSPRPHPCIPIAKARRQEIDGGGAETHDLRPLLQRDQVRGLSFHPGGCPANPPEDHRGPHAGPGILIAERLDEWLPRGIADTGERSLRPCISVAVLTEEGDESAHRRRTDADQGVDGLPVEAVAPAPDEVDDGRDRLVRTETAQDLDGVLPDGADPPLEQGKNRIDGRPPYGNKCIRGCRGDGIVGKDIYERQYSRGMTDLTERRCSLAAYVVVIAVERPDQGNDRRFTHQGKLDPLFPGDEVPRPLGIIPGLPAHTIQDLGGMTAGPGPAGCQRLDQGRDRRLPERTEDFLERLERIPIRIVQGVDALLRRRLPYPEQGRRRRAAEGGIGEQPDERTDRRRTDLRERHDREPSDIVIRIGQEIDQGADRGLSDLPEGSGGTPPGLPVRGSQDGDERADRGPAVLRDVEPCLAGDEVPDRPRIIGRFPPEFSEEPCGRSPGVPVRSIKGPDKEGDRRIADLPKGVKGAELHLAIIIGECRDEGRHGGLPYPHERGGSTGLHRIVTESRDQRRDCVVTDRGEGFCDAPPPPVVRASEGLYQGSHGIGPVLSDGVDGTPADIGIGAAEVVDERLHGAIFAGRKGRFILRREGAVTRSPGRGFIVFIVEPEQPHEFRIGERFGARRRLREFPRLAGAIVRLLIDGQRIGPVRQEGIVKPEELLRGLPGGIRAVREDGVVELQGVRRGLFKLHGCAGLAPRVLDRGRIRRRLFLPGSPPSPAFEERARIRTEYTGQSHDGREGFYRRRCPEVCRRGEEESEKGNAEEQGQQDARPPPAVPPGPGRAPVRTVCPFCRTIVESGDRVDERGVREFS